MYNICPYTHWHSLYVGLFDDHIFAQSLETRVTTPVCYTVFQLSSLPDIAVSSHTKVCAQCNWTFIWSFASMLQPF